MTKSMNLYSHPIIMKSQNPEIEMAELHPLKNSLYQQYEDNIKVHTDEISRCEKKAKWFVIGQLAAFILAISCIAIYAIYYGETVVIVLAIFFVLAYITLRRMDVANGDKMERLKAEGKTKSATYRQYMGRKMMYQNMLGMYRLYGLVE